MKWLTTLVLLLLWSPTVYGQLVVKNSTETSEEFIKRIKPDSMEIAHLIFETNTWTRGDKVIISFFGYDDPKDPNIGFNQINGFVFFPIGDNKYKTIPLLQIEEEAGQPEIVSVFFVNADDDPEKELGVICKYWEHSLVHMGTYYHGFIFDNPTKEKTTLTYDDNLLHKFSGCDCDYGGRSTKAKFKNAQSIKDELKKMGY